MKTTIMRMSFALALATLAVPSSASAAYIDVYGPTPPFISGQGGYQGVEMEGQFWFGPPGVNSAGTAVGRTYKYGSGSNAPLGGRAIRWDAAGTVELASLGTDRNGVTYGVPFAINAAGTTVGSAQKYGGAGATNLGTRAVRWDSSGNAIELAHLGTDPGGFTNSTASAINSAGTTVGYAAKFSPSGERTGEWRAVRWDAGGTAATELGTTPRAASSWALAINGGGTAVGFTENFDAAGNALGQRPVRWNASGTAATELGNLGTDPNGFTNAYAIAITTGGTAIGAAYKYDGSGASKGVRAVRWDPSSTTAVELGTLGADLNGVRNGTALAANDAGAVVGYSTRFDNAGVPHGDRAVRWDPSDTAAIELGVLDTHPGDVVNARAYAINDAGTAVGYSEKYNDSGVNLGNKAVYWGLDGKAVELNTLIDPASGWSLTEADAISDTNWVTGLGTYDPDGLGGQSAYDRPFLLQVPEPGSLALLSLGGVALLHRRRGA